MPKKTDERSPAALLLDTHVWLWLFEGVAAELAPSLVRTLEAAGRDRRLLVSVLSVWEIAMLEARRRVRLSMDCRAWVRRALQAPGLRLHGLTPAVAIESTRLPGTIHGDPIDRLLVATARLTGATIVTRDSRILDYAADGHVAALPAERGRPS
jgi:PIN domain nuclease of toxin-antitoxin system